MFGAGGGGGEGCARDIIIKSPFLVGSPIFLFSRRSSYVITTKIFGGGQ